MSLLDILEELREECRRADINARSVLLEIARLKDPEKMRDANRRTAAGSTRDDLRPRKREETDASRRPKRFAFVYKPKGDPYKPVLSLAKSRVEKSELIHALREVIRQIEAGEIRLPRR